MERIYKEDTPANTIIKIKNILGDLGVVNYESFWGQPYKDVYSVRVESFKTEGCFGTNGKGRDRIFALASGYAEYIERLQNGFLGGTRSLNRFFLKKIKDKVGYCFFPDEKFITKEEFKALPKEYLDDLFGEKTDPNKYIDIYFNKLKENGFPGVLSVPFYSVETKEEVYLPFNLNIMLTGSNGMSAGNSISEGSFQGLCELLERYAASLVFHEQLTPPTIPVEFLSKCEGEFNIIKDIENNGYKVIVKDFSCGKALPVIGVIIVNEKKRKYRLNVGSDTSFRVALSRALTEIHQGIEDKKAFENILLPLPSKMQDYFIKDDKKSLIRRSIELRKFTIDNRGEFPFSLFIENKESYCFKQETFQPKSNYKEEVKYVLQLIRRFEKNIYMRDVSFLGFPSFYIYIPEISPLGRKTSQLDDEKIDISANVKTDVVEDLFFPFEVLLNSKPKIEELLEIICPKDINELKDIKMCDILKLEFDSDFYWANIPSSFFISLLFFICGKYDESIKALKVFIAETKNSKDKYYSEVLKYLKMLSKGVSQSDIKKIISGEIIDSFSSGAELFSNIDIPNCPNCDECTLFENCLTRNKVDYSIRILEKMRNNNVKQSDFNIFCS